MNAKIYLYHIIDSTGNYVERNLPEKSHAQTVINFLEETQGRKDLAVIAEHRPQLHGHKLGRDPDLH